MALAHSGSGRGQRLIEREVRSMNGTTGLSSDSRITCFSLPLFDAMRGDGCRWTPPPGASFVPRLSSHNNRAGGSRRSQRLAKERSPLLSPPPPRVARPLLGPSSRPCGPRPFILESTRPKALSIPEEHRSTSHRANQATVDGGVQQGGQPCFKVWSSARCDAGYGGYARQAIRDGPQGRGRTFYPHLSPGSHGQADQTGNIE